jgi:hypothetical protein
MPNKAVEPTPNSLRSCVAAAIDGGSPRAFGFMRESRSRVAKSHRKEEVAIST